MKRANADGRWAIFLSLCVGLLTGHAAEGFIDAEGVRLRYSDSGEGVPIVFVHGYAEDFEMGWGSSGVLQAMQREGFRTIAFDQRGLGRSEKPQLQRFYGLEMVQDVVRVLDHLEIQKAHVVGFSMGAAVVLKLMTLHPERFLSATLSGYGTPPLPERISRSVEEEIRTNLGRMGLEKTNDIRALALISVGWSEWLVEDGAIASNTIPSLILIGEDDVFLNDSERLATRLGAVEKVSVDGDHGSARSQLAYHQALLEFLRANR